MATSIQNASDSELIDIATQKFNAIDGNLAAYPGVTQQMINDFQNFTSIFSDDLTTHVAS